MASAGSDVPQMFVSSWVIDATETRRNVLIVSGLLYDLYCTSPPGGKRDHQSAGVRLFLGLLTSLMGGCRGRVSVPTREVLQRHGRTTCPRVCYLTARLDSGRDHMIAQVTDADKHANKKEINKKTRAQLLLSCILLRISIRRAHQNDSFGRSEHTCKM